MSKLDWWKSAKLPKMLCNLVLTIHTVGLWNSIIENVGKIHWWVGPQRMHTFLANNFFIFCNPHVMARIISFSRGDPLSNMKLEFVQRADAINFCEKNGWKWYLEAESKTKPRTKSYAINFSWNKRTRTSTK